jgi:hypothetical protein
MDAIKKILGLLGKLLLCFIVLVIAKQIATVVMH